MLGQKRVTRSSSLGQVVRGSRTTWLLGRGVVKGLRMASGAAGNGGMGPVPEAMVKALDSSL